MLFNVNACHLLSFTIGIFMMPISGLVNFTVPKADILHTKSGLILHYLSEYRPARKIVTFTVSIPMYPDMCYLIPRGSMKKIPHCQPNSKIMLKHASESLSMETYKATYARTTTVTTTLPSSTFSMRPIAITGTPKRRPKRWLQTLISIGVGLASLTMSAIDLVQNSNLKSEVKMMQNSLMTMGVLTQNHQAQIIHLKEGQLKLAHELNHTQMALNKTIALVNEHSNILREHEYALRTIMSQTVFLSSRLASVVHAVETHFIHTSIEEILANRLNLHFVHQKDLPNVIDMVSKALNISFEEADNSIPMVELITRLLVRQQIDFLPSKTPEATDDGPLIGKLVFTSYFAAPSQDQDPFSVYELVPIPFNQNIRRLRLAQMPSYLGIEPKSQQFIRWTKEEAAACDFVLMPSCRETPPRCKETQDDCLYQILTDSKLKDCRVELYMDPVFVRRVGHHWAISTNKSIKCHSVATSDLDQHTIGKNDEITLPTMALITTLNTKSLVCDKFSLPALPVNVATPIHLIYNESVNPMKKDFLDLQEALANESHWAKLPYIPSDIQAILEFVTDTPKPATMSYFEQWKEHPTSASTIMLVVMILGLIIIIVYYIRIKKKATTNITIAMPSMKALEAMHE